MKIDFEDYLREQHMLDYTGTDDDAPDHFDNWICDFDCDDWIAYGNLYAKRIEAKACAESDSRWITGSTAIHNNFTK